MDEIGRIVDLLGTLGSWSLWVFGLAMLLLMAALPLLESLAQSRADGDAR